jgi:soluble lytic murein transglycosylase-like protein
MVKGPAAAASLAALVLLFAKPVRGQISSYVDEHGKRVYINADGPEWDRHSCLSGGRRSVAKNDCAAIGNTAQPAREHLRRVGAPVPVGPVGRDAMPSPSREQLDTIVADTAARYQLDPNLVRTIITAESDWNPGAISNKGALGLMQLVPATAARFGVADVFDPAENVEGGVRYLSELLARYQGDLTKSLAGYYAGEGAVERANGLPRDAATRIYVEKITNAYCFPGLRGSFRVPRDNSSRPEAHIIYETVDGGRVVFTNE